MTIEINGMVHVILTNASCSNAWAWHHLCLRARSREDVDRCAALLKEMDATIVRSPRLRRDLLSRRPGHANQERLRSTTGPILWGTEGSNPASSSGESATNRSLPGAHV